MLMGGKCPDTTTQEPPSSIEIPKDCPYGAEGCPKVEELRTELQNIRKENNVIWKKLNEVETIVSANSSSLSTLKWLVFLLVCGATGIEVMI